jgi:hypothetical protein
MQITLEDRNEADTHRAAAGGLSSRDALAAGRPIVPFVVVKHGQAVRGATVTRSSLVSDVGALVAERCQADGRRCSWWPNTAASISGTVSLPSA